MRIEERSPGPYSVGEGHDEEGWVLRDARGAPFAEVFGEVRMETDARFLALSDDLYAVFVKTMQMRAVQRSYFAHRKETDKRVAIHLERELDAMCQRIVDRINGEPEQKGLGI